jgi:hypothetical protein
LAPAASTWATVMTVPAPTRMSPRAAIARMLSAAAVRNVTSATGSPPGDQGTGQRVGIGGVVQDDHRHQTRGAQGFEDISGWLWL